MSPLIGPAVPVLQLAERLHRESNFQAGVVVGVLCALAAAFGVLGGTYIAHRILTDA